MDKIAEIAGKLTEAQKNALLAMTENWSEWPAVKLDEHVPHMRGWGMKRKDRPALIEGIYKNPCTKLRLTPLGLAVRAHLNGE